MLRNGVRWAAHQLLGAAWSLMPKPAKIFQFTGLRRAGNHACINWLANSVYGEKVSHRKLEHYLFLHYPGNRIIFINSYGQERALTLFRQLWKCRKVVAQAEYLFLSLEDETPSFQHFLRHGKDGDTIGIHIRRSIFNTLSSRAKKMDVQAGGAAGGTAVDFRVNEQLLAEEFAARRSHALQWDYDQWLQDPQWRMDFLTLLGLDRDIMPDMSVEGGGSSFGAPGEGGISIGTGQMRYLEHPVPGPWLTLVEQRFLGELSAQEQAEWELIHKQRSHTLAS